MAFFGLDEDEEEVNDEEGGIGRTGSKWGRLGQAGVLVAGGITAGTLWVAIASRPLSSLSFSPSPLFPFFLVDATLTLISHLYSSSQIPTFLSTLRRNPSPPPIPSTLSFVPRVSSLLSPLPPQPSSPSSLSRSSKRSVSNDRNRDGSSACFPAHRSDAEDEGPGVLLWTAGEGREDGGTGVEEVCVEVCWSGSLGSWFPRFCL